MAGWAGNRCRPSGVPALEYVGLALEPQDADRARVEREPRSGGHLHLEPPSGHYAQDVAVGECQRVSTGSAQPRQYAVRSRADRIRRLATRTAVAPQAPVGIALADLRCGQALVVAVVPFAQVLADLRLLGVSGQFAR